MKALVKTLINRTAIEEAERMGIEGPKREYGWQPITFRCDGIDHAYMIKKNEIMIVFSGGDDAIIQGDEDMFNAIAAYMLGAEETMDTVRRGIEMGGDGSGND